ncbi:MAG: thioredoxin family protein [Bacillota bacterium]|nr:thioredoxin family protein [Bacillota bacterium]MDW7676177.1 thioredoxin family protein [Bacillota bacterium]
MKLNPIQSMKALEKQLNRHPLCLLYFGTENCSVCHAAKPRVESVLSRYPQTAGFSCSTEQFPEVAGQLIVFTVPAVLLFHESREIFRSARMIDFQGLETMIQKYSVKDHRGG